VAELLENIEVYADKMNAMLESMLLLSRIRSTKLDLAPVDVALIIRSAIAQLKDRIKKNKVEVKVDPDACPNVIGYPPWIEHVFVNLIDNAIKYRGPNNEHPVIEIRHSTHAGRVRYEIIDNGIGIAPEDQPRLFSPFSRVDVGYKVEGSGIGLSIVQRIIDRMGGEVGVESALGKGSTFWFILSSPDEA